MVDSKLVQPCCHDILVQNFAQTYLEAMPRHWKIRKRHVKVFTSSLNPCCIIQYLSNHGANVTYSHSKRTLHLNLLCVVKLAAFEIKKTSEGKAAIIDIFLLDILAV